MVKNVLAARAMPPEPAESLQSSVDRLARLRGGGKEKDGKEEGNRSEDKRREERKVGKK